MTFKINYDGSSNIFFITALTIPFTKEGIAVDALRVVFQNLAEAMERLEKKLVKISNENLYLDPSKSETLTAYSSLIGDLWVIIDGIRRLELILKYIPDLPVEIRRKLTSIFIEIKFVRDSFQHIDERIDLYFENIGGSVFGEIFWRYRDLRGVPEVLHCLVSGVSKVSRELKIDPVLEQLEHSENIGIYDLELHYVRQDSRKHKTHSKVIIKFDKMIDYINELVDYLEDHYSRFLENSDKTERVADSDPNIYQTKAMTCDPPRIYRFKINEEAFKLRMEKKSQH